VCICAQAPNTTVVSNCKFTTIGDYNKEQKMKNQTPILFLMIATLALMGLTSCSITISGPELAPREPPPEEPPPGEAEPGEVQSIMFTADRTEVQPGECTTLQWNVEGGFGVYFDGQPVEHSGETQVCPEETIPYRLGVDTGETMEEREIVIVVAGEGQPREEPPPGEQPSEGEEVEAIDLMIEPDVIPAGECAVVHWEVIPSEEWPVFLNGQEVPPVGEQEVCREDTTTYELLVEAPGGPQVRTATLHVEGEPELEPPPSEEYPPEEQPPEGEGVEFINLIVEPDVIPPGGCAMLLWEVMPPGEWLVLLDGQEAPHVGEQEVCPGDTTTYELLVEAPGGPQVRTVTLHVEGEPEPGQPPEPTPASPAGPTSTPASPAGPTPPPGVVIDFWVDNNNIAAGTCTTLRWHVANANAVHLDGVGVVGDGSKQICPSSTTVYVLHVVHDAGATEKKVTVKVPGGSPPQPQSADLAVTDLFADKLVQGKVYARITNHGPGNLTNVTVQLSCSGAGWANNSPTPVSSSKSVAVTLNPGQTQQFNTGIVIDTNQYSYYELTCEINYQDRDSANNRHGEVIP
jgi:hypothetical protein